MKPDATYSVRITLRRRPPTRVPVTHEPPTSVALEAIVKAAVDAQHPGFEATVESTRTDK